MPRLTFAVPAFLSLTGDVLLIGKDLWVKTSMTGDKYSHMSSSVTGASFQPTASIDTASGWLLNRPDLRAAA